MRRVLLCALLFASTLVTAQEGVRYERLADLARLWNFVKYLHPTVTAVDWDAALVRAIDRSNQAKSEAEFREAAAGMLAELMDPATKLSSSSPQTQPVQELPTLRDQGGVAVLRFRDGDWSESMKALRDMAPQLKDAKAMVLDIRDSQSIGDMMGFSSKFMPLGKSITGPSTVARQHSGYPSPDGSGSGGYYSSFQYIHAADFQANPDVHGATPFTVFLVNSKTNLPALALAMQDNQLGAIVSEEAVADEITGGTTPFEFGKGLTADVRVQILVHADGSTGLTPNRVLHKTGDAALADAEAIARSGKADAVAHDRSASLPAPWKSDDAYEADMYPDVEHRLLAAMRMYGVFWYFHPYKYLTGEDWNDVLLASLPQMEQAKDARAYELAVAEMVTHAHDSHVGVNGKEIAASLGGEMPPFQLLWVEAKPVVISLIDPDECGREGVRVGDVVVKIDGHPVQERIDQEKRYRTASTPQGMMSFGVMRYLLDGPDGSTVAVTVEGADGKLREVQVKRDKANSQKLYAPAKTGERYRLLNPDIGYADLTKLSVNDVDAMFEAFKNTKSIIFDMRGYPLGTAWAIAPRLVPKQITFAPHAKNTPDLRAPETMPVAAQFRGNIVSGIGQEGAYVTSQVFEQRIPATDKWRYTGKTAMLIDARAISQSEHSGLFYRAANGTIFIGSPTAGANGDVTWFMAPGGLRISFSGHDVRWPDGQQLQRVGLKPDVEVVPTIAGIRAGRDEVLEKAVEVMTGKTK